VDDTKTIVASADMSGDLACVKQALHSDMTGYTISRGDIIQLAASSETSTEQGYLVAQIELDPVYTGNPGA
ncbi:hypothetical protein LCGC14_2706500, partial [marine sediment metagenome]